MLLSNVELIATAPGGVAKLRELILTLAVQGKLVPQDPADEPAGVLLQKIRAERDRLIAEGKIKREKPLAVIAEEEKPFELPKGWEWVHLAALAEQITKGTTPTTFGHSYTPEGVNFVKIENLDRGRLNLAQMTDFISPETHEIMSRSQLSAGDVLFSIAGTIGKTAVVLDADLPANTNQALAIIKGAAKHVNQRFLLLALDSFVSNKVKNKARGGAMNNISLGDLSELLMTIPPLAEQSRIVTRVEELMRLCDALEAKGQLEAAQHAQLVSTLLGTLTASTTPEELAGNWQRVAQHFDLLLDRPEAIDALEQTLLQLAVRGLLVPQDPTDEPASALLQKIRAEKDRLIATGQIKRDKPLSPITDEEKPFELPVGWEWVRLADIADSRLGKMLDKAKNSGKRYPYLRNTNVQWHHIDLDDIKEISLEASELAELRLMPGDLLICEGGYPGRCAIWRDPDREMYFQKALHRVRPRGGIAVELIAIALESDSRAGNLEKHFTGATIKHFVGQALDRYVIALPPLAEQSRIVTRVTALRRLCADLRQRLGERQSVQTRLAEALLIH